MKLIVLGAEPLICTVPKPTGRHVFLGRRGFHDHRQTDIGLACEACGAEAIMRLDQIVTPLPVVGAVFDTGDHSGTNQTGAAYLVATAQMASSVVTLIVGELLKLILVERLFRFTREKLMKIPVPAICIGLRCADSS